VQAEFFELFFELAGQLGVRHIDDRAMENRYDDVSRLADAGPKLAAYLIPPAADAVARHGRFVNFAADHYGDPVGLALGVLSRLNGEQRPAGGPAVAMGISQAVIAMEAVRTGKHISLVYS
jgi:hypothetical protein